MTSAKLSFTTYYEITEIHILIQVQQIEHFFVHYKDLEPNKWVKIEGWGDAERAKTFIRDAIEKHREQNG